VALARALAMSPGLLLLDEPLSALDARVRLKLRQEIKNLQRLLGVTTIMVTHDQEEALAMADRIVVMNQGTIEQIGTPLEIYRTPANAYVAGFIGTMNFIPATVAGPDRLRLAEGVELVCRTGEGQGKAGSPALLCIRPEEIQVRNITGKTPNAFKASIGRMEFLGSFYRTEVALDRVPHRLIADFSLNAVTDLKLAPDSTAMIAFPPDRIQVFPAGS
jgi:iron(III) transport system ATP-binding protein